MTATPQPPPRKLTRAEQLSFDLLDQPAAWAKLGTSPDDFQTCGKCGKPWFDEQGYDIPCDCAR